jgi:3-oxoadipate enol-lactonase
MPYFKKDDCDIYFYQRQTSGPWITLVNGYSRSSKDFSLTSKKLNEIGFSTLCFDNRGCGKTTTDTEFTIQEIVCDIVDLWEHLKITRSHLLGISLGGVIAQLVAQSHPEKIDNLLLISTTAQKIYLTSLEGKPWPQDKEEIFQRLNTYFSFDFQQKNKYLIEVMAKNMYNNPNKEGIKKQAHAIKQFVWEKLQPSKIRAKTLILHGNNDVIIPLEAAKDLQNKIEIASLKVFDNCGHLLMAEKPLDLFDEIKNFLLSQN